MAQNKWITDLLKSNFEYSFYSTSAFTFQQNLFEALKQSFYTFGNNPVDPLLRIYIDNGHRYDLMDNIKSIKKTTNKSFEKEISEALKKDKFCITYNGISKWSPVIEGLMCEEIIKPILEGFGHISKGIDSYAFIGNYGYTPFGIHDDNDHSLLFHLGPESKDVWILPRKEYFNLKKSYKSSFKFQTDLTHFKKHTLKPGDFLFIKEGDFHVFKTSKFSLTFGITIFPANINNQLNQNINDISDSHAEFKTRKDYTSPSPDIDFTYISDLLLKNQVELRNKLESNNYITTIPFQEEIESFKTDILVRNHHFKIIYKVEDSRLSVYIKGRKFSLLDHPVIHELIAEINSEEKISIAFLEKKYVGKITKDSLIMLIRTFYSYGLFIN